MVEWLANLVEIRQEKVAIIATQGSWLSLFFFPTHVFRRLYNHYMDQHYMDQLDYTEKYDNSARLFSCKTIATSFYLIFIFPLKFLCFSFRQEHEERRSSIKQCFQVRANEHFRFFFTKRLSFLLTLSFDWKPIPFRIWNFISLLIESSVFENLNISHRVSTFCWDPKFLNAERWYLIAGLWKT